MVFNTNIIAILKRGEYICNITCTIQYEIKHYSTNWRFHYDTFRNWLQHEARGTLTFAQNNINKSNSISCSILYPFGISHFVENQSLRDEPIARGKKKNFIIIEMTERIKRTRRCIRICTDTACYIFIWFFSFFFFWSYEHKMMIEWTTDWQVSGHTK